MMGNLAEKLTDAQVDAFSLQIFDKDSECYITASGLRYVMGYLGEKLTDAQVGALLLQIFDKDTDGYITASELQYVMGNLAEKLTDAKLLLSYCRYLIKIAMVI